MTGSLTTPQRISGRTAAAALATALAVLAVALALGVAPAGATPAGTNTTTSMVMEGRGWGHGIGMSQYGADGYALHGWQYAAIIEHYYTGVTLGKVGNVPIRVQLRSGVASAAVTDAGRFSVTWGTKTVHPLAAGTTATVTWSGGSYHVRDGAKSWTTSAPVTFVPRKSRLKLLTANDNGYVGRYRGRLRLVHFTDGLMIINALSLETYLYGVVPRESPASWPIEALKAQAVAARSYAYRATGGSGAFDVYCTTASQMYGGADGETAATNLAVNSTKGIVPEYQGTPIVAYFFSTSGGHTENIENVWTGVAPVPYLKGVPDPYDTTSPYHTWPDNPIHRTPAAIAAALGFTKGPLRAIYVLKRGTSPRVVKALLIGDKGWATTDGATLRAQLGLRDAWVYFTSLSIAPSATTTIVYGSAVTLTGRRYPALAANQAVTLHLRPAGGSWSSRAATATAGSSIVGRHPVQFSGFSAPVAPTVTTQYYFSAPTAMGANVLSARVAVDVAPAVTIQTDSSGPVATGVAVHFSGTLTPAAATKTVWLQTESLSGWSDVVRAPVAGDGTYSVTWPSATAGTSTVRVLAPASSTLVAGASRTVTITAN
jgi:stage II sporulation protein D